MLSAILLSLHESSVSFRLFYSQSIGTVIAILNSAVDNLISGKKGSHSPLVLFGTGDISYLSVRFILCSFSSHNSTKNILHWSK